MVLNALFFERRIDSAAAGALIQKGTAEGRAVLERLHERGLIEARGERRGRTYHMAASLYQRLSGVDAYVRTRGFDAVRQRQMVLNALKASPDGKITRKRVADLCRISGPQAYRLLRKVLQDGDLRAHGSGRGAYHTGKRTK